MVKNLVSDKDLKVKGFLFILSAPSGVGKSTVIKKVIAKNKDLKFSVSVTTRPKREGEVEGVDYYFKSREEFYKLIEQRVFLEYAEVYGNFYGTLKKEIEDNIECGYNVIMDIDWQGATLIKDKLPEDILSIYIVPPSIAELERRIRLRNKDSEDIIKFRLAKSKSEIHYCYRYDYLIINDNLDDAANNINSIINSNRIRVDRIKNLNAFLKKIESI